jgi:hypothetical protein
MVKREDFCNLGLDSRNYMRYNRLIFLKNSSL